LIGSSLLVLGNILSLLQGNIYHIVMILDPVVILRRLDMNIRPLRLEENRGEQSHLHPESIVIIQQVLPRFDRLVISIVTIG